MSRRVRLTEITYFGNYEFQQEEAVCRVRADRVLTIGGMTYRHGDASTEYTLVRLDTGLEIRVKERADEVERLLTEAEGP